MYRPTLQSQRITTPKHCIIISAVTPHVTVQWPKQKAATMWKLRVPTNFLCTLGELGNSPRQPCCILGTGCFDTIVGIRGQIMDYFSGDLPLPHSKAAWNAYAHSSKCDYALGVNRMTGLARSDTERSRSKVNGSICDRWHTGHKKRCAGRRPTFGRHCSKVASQCQCKRLRWSSR
ncbi:hypothetical protein IF2G_02180 [Cordyceps javanica]|nr:hypothetical protein IF2G_02180 [Cordyceps javanica]